MILLGELCADLGLALESVGTGIIASSLVHWLQPFPTLNTASLAAIGQHAVGLDDFRLTGLAWACSLLGSAVLALAMERGAISAEAAFRASLVDEDWQMEQWGEDEEALAARAGRERDARALERWFAALSE